MGQWCDGFNHPLDIYMGGGHKIKKTVLKRTYGAMYPMGGGHAIKIVLKGNNGEINKGNILACTCTVKMW